MNALPPHSSAAPLVEASHAARALARGYRNLKFPEPLESEFRAEQRSAARTWIRASLFVAVAASVGSALVDPWIVLESAPTTALVRFGVQAPILLILLLATHERVYDRWYERAMQIGAPLFAIGTILVASEAQAQYASLVGARLLLVCFFVYFLSGLRMPQALASNLAILAALVLAGVLGRLPSDLTTFLAISLASANFIGGAGAYALEYARRTAFIERRLLIEAAELDGLTRLMNRHTFDTRAREAWRKALLARRSAVVLMIDVDHFKLYNDHYGHQAGDECLRQVAASVAGALNCRPGELIARYGGEEIVAVLFDRKESDVQELAQAVVAAVTGRNLSHEATPTKQVSVSVGAAMQPPPLMGSYEGLLRHADSALYAAKRQGRNRAIFVEVRATAAA